jgi:hypothetical protein
MNIKEIRIFVFGNLLIMFALNIIVTTYKRLLRDIQLYREMMNEAGFTLSRGYRRPLFARH